MSGAYAVSRLSDLPRLAAQGADDAEWTPIRQPLGIGAFGVNAWHGDEGDVVIEAHDEIPGADCGCAGHEELYVVLEGRARFVVDGDEIDGPPGTLLALPPHLRREAFAAADGTTVLAIGAPRGEAYAPAPWETKAMAKAGLI